MANIRETIAEVEKLNPALARQLKKYVKDHSYGLVYENNLPEAVRLYTKLPAVGDTVNLLPPRGQEEKPENKVSWIVKSIQGEETVLERDGETRTQPLADLVTLVSYRDVIYPGLRELDRIERGKPDDPYHVVIDAENYHALEALAYCMPGKVDCIYIDPPYNTGAKDWKYNNNYVESTDQYRHSKWLAFMERRLKLARQLLNPQDSVLIVTIDEKEYLRLGLLLEQLFPEATIQMVSDVINPAGVVRKGQLSRSNEFLYFVMFGDAVPGVLPDVENSSRQKALVWNTLRRHDLASRRGTVKGGTAQFYPIYVDNTTHRIVGVGDPIGPEVDRHSVPNRPGCVTVFPIRDDGTEMNWGLVGEEMLERLSKGYVKVGKYTPKKPQPYPIAYLTSGYIADIESGRAVIVGYEENGAVRCSYREQHGIKPTTVWNLKSHNANSYGSALLENILGEKRFSFPKSLYSVKDCLSLFLANKPRALVVDFFAGSGTTLHAVHLLNAEDGGQRRCICVTNNEVSAEEAKQFTKSGLRQGDPAWEAHGIAQYVTWPRTKCAIEGKRPDGTPLEGTYLGTNRPLAQGFSANALFCQLTYESAWPIRLDRAFDAIAPLLWMQAGCTGPILRRIGKSYLTTDTYGVLFDYNQASKFCDKVKSTPSIQTVYVVTDDQRRYSNMCKRLPTVQVHRLYETYLRTFEICGEGGLD